MPLFVDTDSTFSAVNNKVPYILTIIDIIYSTTGHFISKQNILNCWLNKFTIIIPIASNYDMLYIEISYPLKDYSDPASYLPYLNRTNFAD